MVRMDQHTGIGRCLVDMQPVKLPKHDFVSEPNCITCARLMCRGFLMPICLYEYKVVMSGIKHQTAALGVLLSSLHITLCVGTPSAMMTLPC